MNTHNKCFHGEIKKIPIKGGFLVLTIFLLFPQVLESARHYMDLSKGPYALLVKRQTFMPYKLKLQKAIDFPMTREAAVQKIVDNLGPKDVVVGTTGMLSRELYEYRFANSSPWRWINILHAGWKILQTAFWSIFLIFLRN